MCGRGSLGPNCRPSGAYTVFLDHGSRHSLAFGGDRGRALKFQEQRSQVSSAPLRYRRLVVLSCGQLLSPMTLLLFVMLDLKIKAWYIWGRAKALGSLSTSLTSA